jgi:hypothetical protein
MAYNGNPGDFEMFFSGDTVTWQHGYIASSPSWNLDDNVRDPSIAKIGSKYFLGFTCGAIVGSSDPWCFSSSTDLLAWTPGIAIPITGAPYIKGMAPEWVKNSDNSTYLDGMGCPHIVFVNWSGGWDFSIFEQHPANNCSDPSTVGTVWSMPVAITQTDTYMLDPFCVFDGMSFNLWYVAIAPGTNQSLQYATSSTLTGAYIKQSSGVNWAGFQNGGQINQEGPALLCLTYSTSCTHWRIFFDQIGNPPGDLVNGQLFYSDSTNGFAGPWSAPTNIMTPTPAKHGTVIVF